MDAGIIETSSNLVGRWDDILKNVQTLELYRHSKNMEDFEFYKSLIKRGTCFLANKINEKLVFTPSRFIGYLDNSREKHITNRSKDGRITNPKILTVHLAFTDMIHLHPRKHDHCIHKNIFFSSYPRNNNSKIYLSYHILKDYPFKSLQLGK